MEPIFFVPDGLPSLRQTATSLVFSRSVTITASPSDPPTTGEESDGERSEAMNVPSGVPSVRHSAALCAASYVTKNTSDPTRRKPCGSEPLAVASDESLIGTSRCAAIA